MIRFYKIVFLLLTLVACSFGLEAQVYPIRADIQMKAPYSLYLSDYAMPGSDKMRVNLRLLQTNRPLYAVALRFTIEGAGITITSATTRNHEPINLSGGETVVISGSDLASYFQPENLVFNGFDKNQYLQTHKLPEGIYQITVEAIDFNNYSSGLVVSNKGTTTAWFMLNDPPRFNQPIGGDVVQATFPQNVFVQWLPQHLNSPNGSFDSEYELKLVEINPGQNIETRNQIDLQVANQAIQSQDPIYETVTTSTSVIYNNSMPLLIPGKFYAMRVRVREKFGLDLFKNNGYSEVVWFRFGEACLSARNLQVDVPNFRKAELKWDANGNNTRFVVSYRPESGGDWYEQETLVPSSILTDLQPSTAYEYQIRAYCGSLPAETSDPFSFKTPEDNQQNAEVRCGEATANLTIDNTTALASASAGVTFKVGAFEMRVLEVDGSNGTYTGKGEIFVPFLATMIKTEFSSIRVNASKEVFEGVVKAQSTGISLMDQEALKKLIEEEQTELTKNSKLCQEQSDTEQPSEIEVGEPVMMIGEFVVAKGDSIIVNGKVVIVDENTVLQPHDVVTIPKQKDKGKNVIINKEEGGLERGKKKYSVKPANGGTGDLGALEGELDDLIQKILKELKESTKDSITVYGGSVDDLSKQILQILKDNKLPKELVGGQDEKYLWNGMSKRKKISDTPIVPTKPIEEIYVKHRALYVKDSLLQFVKVKNETVSNYLEKDKLKAFRDEIKEELQYLEQEQLDQYQPGKPGYENFKILLRKKVEEKVDNTVSFLMSSNTTSFLLLDDTDYNTALASADNDVSKYWMTTPLLLADPSAVSPAIYAHALQYIIQTHKRQIYMMNPAEATDLPIGLVQEVAGKEWIVAIDNMFFTTQGAYFNAFMSVEVPFADNVKLPFALQKIKFTPYGISG